MASSAASSSRLPDYTSGPDRPSGPRDLCERIDSLSSLHPDPTHPAHAFLLASLSSLSPSRDAIALWSNVQSGITVRPQALRDPTSLEVSPLARVQAGGQDRTR